MSTYAATRAAWLLTCSLTLVLIGMQQGHLSAEGAAEWLQTLTREGRYVRDVY